LAQSHTHVVQSYIERLWMRDLGRPARTAGVGKW